MKPKKITFVYMDYENNTIRLGQHETTIKDQNEAFEEFVRVQIALGRLKEPVHEFAMSYAQIGVIKGLLNWINGEIE